jgi:pilus assembly protein CpaB
MKSAQVIVLGIAITAGAAALFLLNGAFNKAPPPAQQAVQEELPTVDVLVARRQIELGETVKPGDLQWQKWAKSSASSSFIRRSDKPDAETQLAGSIARQPFMEGEPIREQKLINANGSGFMAAILPSGKRAVSTEISDKTGAGGFILPNDRVDVILTKREKGSSNADIVRSAVVLTNVRVLAIDQAPTEKDGKNAVLGKTATLELTPGEVQILAMAQLSARDGGALSLALRSIADAQTTKVVADNNNKNAITIYRGATRAETLSCDPVCGKR